MKLLQGRIKTKNYNLYLRYVNYVLNYKMNMTNWYYIILINNHSIPTLIVCLMFNKITFYKCLAYDVRHKQPIGIKKKTKWE